MAVDDGTYVVRNVANTSLCINSCGATDGNGANVWLFTFDETDASYVTVWTRSDGSRQMMFPATGKCIDISNNTVAQGANVKQYSDNDTPAQRWTITQVPGKTVSYDGVTYGVHKIYATETVGEGTEYLLEAEGTGTPSSGTNLCIAVDETTSTDQMWFFVPANPVPTGTYRIHPAVDTSLVLDVAGGSTGIGTRILIFGRNDGNHQCWWLQEAEETGRSKLSACHGIFSTDGRVLATYDTNSASVGQMVCIDGDWGGTDQRWVLTPHGTSRYNGNTVPTYIVRNFASEGGSKVLDVTGGSSTVGTWLQLWEQNLSDAQRFYFEPWSMTSDDLPSPADLALSKSASGANAARELAANGTTTWHPAWRCTGTTYKGRYRYRMRKVGKSIDSWGVWRSMADGSPANDGLGTTFRPNVTVSETPVKVSTAITLPEVDNATYDYGEVQFELSRYESDYRGRTGLCAHGATANATVRLAWEPTVTVTEVAWSPDGLRVGYASDYLRGGNTVTVYGGILSRSHTQTGMASTGTVVVPPEKLRRVPSEGESVTLGLILRTDVWTKDGSYTAEVAWDASHGLTVTPEYTDTDRGTKLVTVPRTSSDTCWLVWDGQTDGCEEVSSTSTTRTFEVVYPFGADYNVFVLSTSGSSWGTSGDSMPAVPGDGFWWNWYSSDGPGCARIRLGIGSVPTSADKREYSSTSYVTVGRAHPAVRFGTSSSVDRSVSGGITSGLPTDVPHATREDLFALNDAHHAIFRDPLGGRYRVAVTGVDIPIERERYASVAVSQVEETL